MIVNVKKIFDLGLSKATSSRNAETAMRGRLQIMREKSLALGRETTVARLWDTTSGMNTEMCGPLFDAEVILLKEGQMRVKGFEMVQVSSNPKTHQTYYQTWEVLLK